MLDLELIIKLVVAQYGFCFRLMHVSQILRFLYDLWVHDWRKYVVSFELTNEETLSSSYSSIHSCMRFIFGRNLKFPEKFPSEISGKSSILQFPSSIFDAKQKNVSIGCVSFSCCIHRTRIKWLCNDSGGQKLVCRLRLFVMSKTLHTPKVREARVCSRGNWRSSGNCMIEKRATRDAWLGRSLIGYYYYTCVCVPRVVMACVCRDGCGTGGILTGGIMEPRSGRFRAIFASIDMICATAHVRTDVHDTFTFDMANRVLYVYLIQ